MGGVGGVTTKSPYGAYTIKLPLCDDTEARFSGVCLRKVTETFPRYPIHGAVEQDIHTAFKAAGGSMENLPTLPRYVGGDVDFMMGIKYLRYHPEVVFQLPSGLTIYRSKFNNAHGGRGVIGPHEVFSAMEKQFNIQRGVSTFLCNQERLYTLGYQVNPDVGLLGFKNPYSMILMCTMYRNPQSLVSKSWKVFENAESTGSEISYRCIKCRACKSCKDCEQTEAISFKEEVEDLINTSIVVDLEKRKCIARLPFIQDPLFCLLPNKHNALKVYYQQLRKLKNNIKDKEEIILSESKLQKLGYVDYVKNLSLNDQEILRFNEIKNFIPWRVVWKSTSISGSCRLVFDASQPTDSGKSLNDILAKGRNNMNKLQEILIRWSLHKVAFHTDVQKMYNSVELRKGDWCFQRYVWHDQLNTVLIPEEKIIKTLIWC